ncbi:Hypothetical protein BQ3484_251 [Cedratvirus A11]|uniref:Uncharacterized protein n=1 Tax=Cedratvirus A11 TaxID=1903266 RepID=A0A1M7XUF3_9VIRU|nr:Hypothetical protein BQ3484_251 [Cedratvirus A11]SHO33319.1 Hypothetical protein BQ3484_251 [Cedratvirus A11]
MSSLLQKKSLCEFFVYSDLNSELPHLPDEIKSYIHSYVCSCSHGCAKAGKKCCFCSDKRPVEEMYVYKDGKGLKKTKQRHLHYCPVCKKLAQRGKGPK